LQINLGAARLDSGVSAAAIGLILSQGRDEIERRARSLRAAVVLLNGTAKHDGCIQLQIDSRPVCARAAEFFAFRERHPSVSDRGAAESAPDRPQIYLSNGGLF
jgi:hypothetical protein